MPKEVRINYENVSEPQDLAYHSPVLQVLKFVHHWLKTMTAVLTESGKADRN